MKKDLVFFNSYCNDEKKQDILLYNIERIRYNLPELEIGIHANYPLPYKIQKQVDHYIYQDLNFKKKTKHTRYLFWELPYFNKKFLSFLDTEVDAGYSCLSQIKNISKYFRDYNRITICNYDIILDDKIYNEMRSELKDDLKTYLFDDNEKYSMVLFSFKPTIFYNKVAKFINIENYTKYKFDPEHTFFSLINKMDIKNNYNKNYKPKDYIGNFYEIFSAIKNPYFNNKFLSFDDKPNLYIWGTDIFIEKMEIEISYNKKTTLKNTKNGKYFHSEIDMEP